MRALQLWPRHAAPIAAWLRGCAQSRQISDLTSRRGASLPHCPHCPKPPNPPAEAKRTQVTKHLQSTREMN